MPKTLFRFTFLGLPVSASGTLAYGSGILGLVVFALAFFVIRLTFLDALIAGVLGIILHWVGEVLHQYGHYLAGRSVGYPATGVRLWWLLGTTLYPADEPALPASTHIRRALGGPLLSTLVTILAGGLWFVVRDQSPMFSFLFAFMVFEGIFIFAGGAFFPISSGSFVTDGGTILHWLQKK